MIGIVILNYNNYQDTLSCIDNILDNKIKEDFFIYVVDNKSTNDSVKYISDKVNGINNARLIENQVNGGFSAGNNVGFRQAINDGCRYILCTNNDVLFKKDAINLMIDRLDKESDCAVCGPKVYLPDGSVQNCNKGILDAHTFVVRRKGLNIFDITGREKKYTYKSYNYDGLLYPLGMVSGCCFLIRSDVLEKIGYLDENVFLYHEEDILGAKLRKINYKVVLDPKAEIIHFGGKSTGPSVNAFGRYQTFRSAMYYLINYTKNGWFWMSMAKAVVKSGFFIKGIFNKEYRKYYKELKRDIKSFKLNAKNVH
ncbi:MAG: glycosyltransferase family 2 protein [Clostridia bacterium]|nr:glycosyltransferase family 2 protein [Clostridia bacterium]